VKEKPTSKEGEEEEEEEEVKKTFAFKARIMCG